MQTSGEVVDLDLGIPQGREAGFRHPAVIVTAQRILDAAPTVLQVVPLTTTIRDTAAEILVEPDPDNGLTARSAAQCQHIRAISSARVLETRGTVGPVVLAQIRDAVAIILDIPS